ncbi:hypothetical protein AMJ39_03785 [candidate division TA06 bacterium DG_24]|uniref:Protein-export membrane protein SecF n=1 Tax=candidate division TA06 bacterium DG_24 TaxID=1703770 RepID=A0A0S7WU30_UNCT6|nr:MAG: hypothetical protein AMJ39_03785 [candidate division TA06 bacterium DG_24]
MLRILAGTHVNFIGHRRQAFVASAIVVAVGIISLIMHGGPNYGIDFTGGQLVHIRFEKPMTSDQVRASLARIGLAASELQRVREMDEFMIRLPIEEGAPGALGYQPGAESAEGEGPSLEEEAEQGGGEGSRETAPGEEGGGVEGEGEAPEMMGGVSDISSRIIAAVREDYPDNPVTLEREELIGPRIGKELQRRAIYAVLLGMAAILIYISFRFDFRFAVGAVIALFHDVLITVGIFSILNKEITIPVIAAVLTVVGYSINDSIVVSDRIRENIRTMRREAFDSMVNVSINQTLSRTVITSLTTLIVLFALFFFGGAVIHDFAFALLIGVLVGTYSSVFIVAPIVVEWEHVRPARRERKR